MARTREPQLSPAFSDDTELVRAYARRGRHWGPIEREQQERIRFRFRPCNPVCWPGGLVLSGTVTRIPGAD